jgi:hypothetical protein
MKYILKYLTPKSQLVWQQLSPAQETKRALSSICPSFVVRLENGISENLSAIDQKLKISVIDLDSNYHTHNANSALRRSYSCYPQSSMLGRPCLSRRYVTVRWSNWILRCNKAEVQNCKKHNEWPGAVCGNERDATRATTSRCTERGHFSLEKKYFREVNIEGRRSRPASTVRVSVWPLQRRCEFCCGKKWNINISKRGCHGCVVTCEHTSNTAPMPPKKIMILRLNWRSPWSEAESSRWHRAACSCQVSNSYVSDARWEKYIWSVCHSDFTPLGGRKA